MEAIVDVVQGKISNYNQIDKDSIILSDEVRNLCEKNYCGSYGKNWVCPPAIENLDSIRDTFENYNNFMVLHEVYELNDSYDWEGMVNSAKDFQEKLLSVKKGFGKDFDFKIFGVGACSLCKTCTYPEDKPCRRPEDKIISLEASGIDVMSLMKDNNLQYNNGPNTVTYIGGILY
ncbi:DUF2284 domain-containing protein [Alkalibaculum sp. M08DMB]|uniref:DUF2284 domain-containing protein n=1 Tax=Alkalibaculum sporogenes TaxID=2655001 RepID=A0A6A7KAU5_9FIRM|nr:DUF2284 domain-containing protein [Alkalibaculum sporogenes]